MQHFQADLHNESERTEKKRNRAYCGELGGREEETSLSTLFSASTTVAREECREEIGLKEKWK